MGTAPATAQVRNTQHTARVNTHGPPVLHYPYARPPGHGHEVPAPSAHHTTPHRTTTRLSTGPHDTSDQRPLCRFVLRGLHGSVVMLQGRLFLGPFGRNCTEGAPSPAIKYLHGLRGSIRRGACAVRVLGLFRISTHPQPTRGKW